MEKEPERLITGSRFSYFVAVNLCVVLLATIFLAPVNVLWAGSGERIVLPMNARQAIHGVRLEADTRWVDGNGYRPVRVRIATEPAVASPRERLFRVTMTPIVAKTSGVGRARPASPVVSKWASVAVTQQVVLAEGALRGDATLMIPQSSFWQALRIVVEEDGAVLEECSDVEGYLLAREFDEWTEVSPSVAVISRHVPTWDDRMSTPWEPVPESIEGVTLLPQMTELAALVYPDHLGQLVGPRNDSDLQQAIARLPKFEFLAPGDVPSRWIGLSCLDLIFIDLHDARELAAESPEKWNAIRTWVESGQTLFVYGLEREFADLADLETLLGINDALPSVARVISDRPVSVAAGDTEHEVDVTPRDDPHGSGVPGAAVEKNSGWVEPKRRDPQSISLRLLDQLSPHYPYPLGNVVTANGASGRGEEAHDGRPVHRIRAVGLGRVVAVASVDPFWPRYHLAEMLFALKTNRWAWMLRHGFSLRRENSDLRSFQIPGVGEPPRTTYLVLITLFALAIGPLNYWALWRIRRLHFLLVTVPLAAIVVTFLLLSYAVVRDGFQPRVFARSLTNLDQRQGRAVTWSTQAYYASLPPADGLRFSTESLVYPLDADVQPHPGTAANRRSPFELNWPRGQQLRGNYLRPRKTQHFAVISGGSQPARLVLEPLDGGWSVTNELGSKLTFLLVHGAPGEYFHAASIEVGEKRKVLPRRDADARGDLLRLFQDYDAPISSMVQRSRSNYQLTIDGNAPEPRLSTGIFESLMNEIRTQPDTVLVPRTYIAVVEWPEWLDVGIEGVRREPGLHVILGHF